jgi:sugar phosphate isomerase/epimerase
MKNLALRYYTQSGKRGMVNAFVQAMHRIGYDGFISYELCHPVFVRGTRRRSDLEYAHEQAALALEYMRGLIGSAKDAR